MNKIILVAGVLVVSVAAMMMFCQERCFLGVDLELWPAVLGIIGIGLISTSNFVLLMKKVKKT
jgi:hypothetical protein